MKRIVLFALLIAQAVVLTAQQPQIIDKVIATVGGELVLLSEVEEQHALSEAQRGNMPANARCSILDQLLTTKLLLNQAKIDSVVVSDEEVEEQLNARIDRILSFMNNDVSQFEDYYGQTINEVKEQFREDLRNQLMVERMRAQVLASVTVTPSEVKKFFEEIPRDSLPYFNSEVEIGEIVYQPKINKEERRRVIERLEEIRRRIVEEDADFSAMAQKYSEDGSARLGGDLGWSKRGRFVSAFEAAAYKLDVDEVSEIVESEFGFHIIKMEGRRGNSIKVRHILLKPEITEDDIERARAHLDSVRQLITEDSISFSLAVKRFSNEDVQSYNNDGRMVNPATGNTFFEIGDLDPDIYFTIDTMEVGEVSAPFEYATQLGEPMLRIVQLQSRTNPHRASLETDYSKIQKAAIESKKGEFLYNWVKDKIDATYVDVDRMYNGCEVLEIWRKEGVARP